MFSTKPCVTNKTMSFPCMLILSLVFVYIGTQASPISLPGCPRMCGNISIPYPFGLKPGCFLNKHFLISCDTSYNPPKAFLSTSTINVTEIMLSSGELRILVGIAHLCYDQKGTLITNQTNQYRHLQLTKFPMSYSKNKFTIIGCDTTAYFSGGVPHEGFITGCYSECRDLTDVVNGTCTGIGCCQTPIPKNALGTHISLSSDNNHTNVSSFDPCSYAFVVEETAYKFTSLDFLNLKKVVKLPVILDWTIGDQRCSEAKKNLTSYACKEKSYCSDSDNGPGYRCNCKPGYEGNPYLPNGCQDIDECKLHQPCNKTCLNLPGTYKCICPSGYKGDGKKDGKGCLPSTHPSDKRLLIIGLGTSVSISTLLLASAWLYWGLQQRKLVKLRRKNFHQNGGPFLQQLLSRRERSIEAFNVYTAEDLRKATDNYDDSMILGQGGQGTVYKGVLPDKTIVAIKRSNIVDRSQVEQFINEVVILSQINHRNVVKLLGCCLETEVPMLVSEFITNGTLFEQVHGMSNGTSPLLWDTRLRIAAEAAGALAYLHSAATVPIIHRDVKPSNILLDDSYTAKVSDFGASRLVPVDKTSLTTLVQGTLGYLDPEYLFSSVLSEKSDVYSFGVVLVELITGEMPHSFDRRQEERSLAMYFVSSLKENRLFSIVEEGLKREESKWQLNQVANLAARCLRVKGEERPTMKEVATDLEVLMKMKMHPWVENDSNDEETETLLGGAAVVNDLGVGR